METKFCPITKANCRWDCVLFDDIFENRCRLEQALDDLKDISQDVYFF